MSNIIPLPHRDGKRLTKMLTVVAAETLGNNLANGFHNALISPSDIRTPLIEMLISELLLDNGGFQEDSVEDAVPYGVSAFKDRADQLRETDNDPYPF